MVLTFVGHLGRPPEAITTFLAVRMVCTRREMRGYCLCSYPSKKTTRKCQMTASGLHRVVHSGDDGNALKSLKQETALSAGMELSVRSKLGSKD